MVRREAIAIHQADGVRSDRDSRGDSSAAVRQDTAAQQDAAVQQDTAVQQDAGVQQDAAVRQRSVLGRDIDTLVLLAGSVGARPLSACVGRSVLDLPVATDRTLMQTWREESSVLSRQLEGGSLSVRVVIDQSARGLAGWRTPQPEAGPHGNTDASTHRTSHESSASRSSALNFVDRSAGHGGNSYAQAPWRGESLLAGSSRIQYRLERDPVAYRGTAGVLRDLCAESDLDQHILVASAHQILLEPLSDLVEQLSETDADVSCLTHSDGTPAGLMLVRRSCLDLVPTVGFVDFKEQALPKISKKFSVKFVVKPETTTLPLRTPAEYIAALRIKGLRIKGEHAESSDSSQQGGFVLVEKGAEVHPRATLQDAVVLRGGTVHAGAFVARSLVGPSGVVRRGRTVVDTFVGAPTRDGRGATTR